MSGVRLEHVLDPAHHLVGLRQRGADRHVVVEHERALVHVGHEAGLDRVDLDGMIPKRDLQSKKEDQPGTIASSASSMTVFGNRRPTLRARS